MSISLALRSPSRCVSETKVPIPWVSESCGSNKGTTPDHPLALIDTRVKPLPFQGGKLSQGAREGQASVHSLVIGAQYVRIALWWESIPRTEFKIGALRPPHDARAIKAMAQHSGLGYPDDKKVCLLTVMSIRYVSRLEIN